VLEDSLLQAGGPLKPPPGAPLADKQRYIQDKYVGRAFVAPAAREAAQARWAGWGQGGGESVAPAAREAVQARWQAGGRALLASVGVCGPALRAEGVRQASCACTLWEAKAGVADHAVLCVLCCACRLWEAVEAGDVGAAAAALAGGGSVNAPYRTPRAQRLVDDTGARQAAAAGGDAAPEAAGCGHVTALHCAAAAGAGARAHGARGGGGGLG